MQPNHLKLMDKIISIDLNADFGFLKKPDTNDPIYLTFNILHKPALLGILGAILGLQGFSEVKKIEKKNKKKIEQSLSQEKLLPDYYKKLNELKVGIKPLNAENGNFEKTIIKYNNGVGYANRDGGNLIIAEQTLIRPNYRCYILIKDDSQLYEYLKHSKAEYLPYLGKNDFSLWWSNFTEYQFSLFNLVERSFQISSIFIKEDTLKEGKKKQITFNPLGNFSENKFMYFENLPIKYNTDLMQYEYESFAYTNWDLKQNYNVDNLYKLSSNEIVQLF